MDKESSSAMTVKEDWTMDGESTATSRGCDMDKEDGVDEGLTITSAEKSMKEQLEAYRNRQKQKFDSAAEANGSANNNNNNNNKRKILSDNERNSVANHKKSKNGTSSDDPIVLDDEDDNAHEDKALVVIPEFASTTRHRRRRDGPSPLDHPSPNPSYFQQQIGQMTAGFVLYATFREDPDSMYMQGLEQCHKICTSLPSGDQVHNQCFQRDGTRHVTMTRAVRMTWEEARRIRYNGPFNGKAAFEVPVRFDGFQTGWAKKGVHHGVYLKVSKEGQDNLRQVFDRVIGWPDKATCDHMSIYRKRSYENQSAKLKIFGAINRQLAKHQWGALIATSIRIKVVGSEYDECKVLVGN